MRNTMLAFLALSATTAATVTGSSPAAAYDYRYCLQGRGRRHSRRLFLQQLCAVHGGGLGARALLQHQSSRRVWKAAAGSADLPGLLRGAGSRLARSFAGSPGTSVLWFDGTSSRGIARRSMVQKRSIPNKNRTADGDESGDQHRAETTQTVGKEKEHRA
jgi:hypothetical protein